MRDCMWYVWILRQALSHHQGWRLRSPPQQVRHHRQGLAQRRTSLGRAEAEAQRAEADTWTAYSSTAGGPREVTEDNGFAALGVPPRLVQRLARDGIVDPFPIQAATIPDVLAGKDVLGRGRTGSGKTIAFGAPLVEKLMEHGGGTKRKMGRAPRALILAPTRELALQIDRTVQPIARLAALARASGIPFHTDAVQAAGWLPLDTAGLGVDALSISGHKLGAPKGNGALFVRSRTPLEPLLHGGGQERDVHRDPPRDPSPGVGGRWQDR